MPLKCSGPGRRLSGSSARSLVSPRCRSLSVLIDRVDRKPDDFDVAPVELMLELGHIAGLGGSRKDCRAPVLRSQLTATRSVIRRDARR
jgi:hypothetical protein